MKSAHAMKAMIIPLLLQFILSLYLLHISDVIVVVDCKHVRYKVRANTCTCACAVQSRERFSTFSTPEPLGFGYVKHHWLWETLRSRSQNLAIWVSGRMLVTTKQIWRSWLKEEQNLVKTFGRNQNGGWSWKPWLLKEGYVYSQISGNSRF